MYACKRELGKCKHAVIRIIGADYTGATGTFALVGLLARVLGREYSFAPVPFGYYIHRIHVHAYILKANSYT